MRTEVVLAVGVVTMQRAVKKSVARLTLVTGDRLLYAGDGEPDGRNSGQMRILCQRTLCVNVEISSIRACSWDETSGKDVAC